MGFTRRVSNMILDALLRGEPLSPPDLPLYLSLHTGPPGDEGANELLGNGYERLEIEFKAATSRVALQLNPIDYYELPFAEVTHIGLWDSQTSDRASRFWWWGRLDEEVYVGDYGTLRFDENTIEARLR